MRKDFSEIEFQCALMIGYYAMSKTIDDLGFYMPTQTEENILNYIDGLKKEKISQIIFFM